MDSRKFRKYEMHELKSNEFVLKFPPILDLSNEQWGLLCGESDEFILACIN